MTGLSPRLKHNPVTAGIARWHFHRRARSVERFYFVATTGRSGTTTLCGICARVPGCHAVHEPYPVMNRDVLRAAADGDDAYVTRHYHRVKSVNILRSAAGSRYYVETNHQFVKTFAADALRDLAGRCTVIHLVRDPVDVANSIRVSGTHPGTDIGNSWWLDPRGPANLIPVADALESDDSFRDPFFRGLWYWYEIEARTRRLRERFGEVPFVTCHTEDLSDPTKVTALLTRLGMPVDEETIADACTTTNPWQEQPAAALCRDEADRMHEAFRALLASRGMLPSS